MKEKFPKSSPLKLAAIVAAVVVVLGGVLAIVLTSCGGPQTFTGYLICQKCGLAGTCVSSNEAAPLDLTANPEKHTVRCDRMADCIVSGYGIAVKQPDGKYKYYRFDSAGSTLALDNVIYVTKKADNLLVEVKGKLKGNTIEVQSIVEK
jgi:hypothetical protein